MTTAAQVLEQYERDLRYYYAHYDELLAQHPKEWVVIHAERVVGAAEDVLPGFTYPVHRLFG